MESQVFLEECRYETKEKKMITFIDAELDLDDSDDSNDSDDCNTIMCFLFPYFSFFISYSC